MKKFLVGGAAAVALLGLAPAIAQTNKAAPEAAKVHTRAAVQAKVAEHFARLDADRDGFVTKAEVNTARQALRAKVVARVGERRGHRFEQIDSNKDGSISRAEFDAAHAQHAGQRGQRMHGRAMMGRIGGHMFAMADADKDQRVSLQEAQAAALAHFDRMDANRDGQLTREERRQMRRHMITERRPG